MHSKASRAARAIAPMPRAAMDGQSSEMRPQSSSQVSSNTTALIPADLTALSKNARRRLRRRAKALTDQVEETQRHTMNDEEILSASTADMLPSNVPSTATTISTPVVNISSSYQSGDASSMYSQSSRSFTPAPKKDKSYILHEPVPSVDVDFVQASSDINSSGIPPPARMTFASSISASRQSNGRAIQVPSLESSTSMDNVFASNSTNGATLPKVLAETLVKYSDGTPVVDERSNFWYNAVYMCRMLPDIHSRFKTAEVEYSESRLVDNTQSLMSFLDEIDSRLEHGTVSLMIDVESHKHGRGGTISTLQVTFAHRPAYTWILDILKLKRIAFETISKRGHTIAAILQDNLTPKVFFDVRLDSCALYTEYNIKLEGVIDLQLMELACRHFDLSRDFLYGLEKCIQDYLPLSPGLLEEWLAIKRAGRACFSDFSDPIWLERPMTRVLQDYAANDTLYMSVLYLKFGRLLAAYPAWNELVIAESASRIMYSQNPNWVSSGGSAPYIFSIPH